MVTDHDAHTWVEVWFPRLGLAAVRSDARAAAQLGRELLASSSDAFDAAIRRRGACGDARRRSTRARWRARAA